MRRIGRTRSSWLRGFAAASPTRGRCVPLLARPAVFAALSALLDKPGTDRRLGARPSKRPPGRSPSPIRRRRSFEKAYWKTIAMLASGRYANKDNADCIEHSLTQPHMADHRRDLEALGDFLIAHYERAVGRAEMAGRAIVGELPFRWQTDFHFPWWGGWAKNQAGETYERDLLVVIPGRNRRQAIVMADHYDTAYMEDVFGYGHGGGGPRLAAAGADDNHSATAALMLAAPIFLGLSRQGKLARDIWLLHLTGEEFPADCMGARHVCQCLVEGDLRMRLPGGRWRDLRRTRVEGVYVLDMVAHNCDRQPRHFPDVPRAGRQSLWLAEQAARPTPPGTIRRRLESPLGPPRPRTPQRPDGGDLARPALHPHLSGEVRRIDNPRSTLYNTDGQFSPTPACPWSSLWRTTTSIGRVSRQPRYVANIDLDYGAAVAAIAVEAVARAAAEEVKGVASADVGMVSLGAMPTLAWACEVSRTKATRPRKRGRWHTAQNGCFSFRPPGRY